MKRVFLSLMLLSLVCACDRESCDKGEGPSETRTRLFEPRSALRLDMVADIVISQDTFFPGVILDAVAQPEMHNILTYDDSGDELRVYLDGCIREHNAVTLNTRYFNLPNQLEVNSAGSILSDELLPIDSLKLINDGLGDIDLLVRSDYIEGEISSSGNLQLGGACKKVSLVCLNSGDLRAFDLIADTVEIEYFGTNFIEVYATKQLIVNFGFEGEVSYRGNPEIIIQGTGEVIDRNL